MHLFNKVPRNPPNAICDCGRRVGFLFAPAAIGTAVADESAAAMGAVPTVVRHVQLVCRDLPAEAVGQFPVDRLSFIVHAGFIRHFALHLLFRQMISLAVFDKYRPGFDKAEGDVLRAHSDRNAFIQSKWQGFAPS